jgi:hypothetical protein
MFQLEAVREFIHPYVSTGEMLHRFNKSDLKTHKKSQAILIFINIIHIYFHMRLLIGKERMWKLCTAIRIVTLQNTFLVFTIRKCEKNDFF